MGAGNGEEEGGAVKSVAKGGMNPLDGHGARSTLTLCPLIAAPFPPPSRSSDASASSPS